MGELSKILTPALKTELVGRAVPVSKRRLKPATVARRQQELGDSAWFDREHVARETAEWGIFAWHAGKTPEEVRAIYGKAARSYYDLLQALDFELPVEKLWSARSAEDGKQYFGKRFVRMKRDRYGQTYAVHLEKLAPSDYAAECALTCAMIAQDWSLADSLAKEIPVPLSARARPAMTLSLLRYTVLDRKAQVEKRCKLYSAHAGGIDFPPRRADFALAIVHRNEELLAKALKATIQSFRRKWSMSRYVTPRWLRHYGSREKIVEHVTTRLCGLRWGYSAWAVAMICLAARLGMQLHTDPRRFSDFVPHELCVPLCP
jgi:hypothetical protein